MGRYDIIEDNFKIKEWTVKVLYQCTCDDIDFIIKILKDIKCPVSYIDEALDNLENCKLNTGLTYSNLNLKSSVIIINKTSSLAQLVNTISHEYFHLITHISKGLHIEDEEELASLNGNLNMRTYNLIKDNDFKVGF